MDTLQVLRKCHDSLGDSKEVSIHETKEGDYTLSISLTPLRLLVILEQLNTLKEPHNIPEEYIYTYEGIRDKAMKGGSVGEYLTDNMLLEYYRAYSLPLIEDEDVGAFNIVKHIEEEGYIPPEGPSKATQTGCYVCTRSFVCVGVWVQEMTIGWITTPRWLCDNLKIFNKSETYKATIGMLLRWCEVAYGY